MRLALATLSITALLTAGAAMAQAPSPARPAGSPGAGGTTSQAPAPKTPALNPLMREDVSKLKGTNVYGNDDKKLGDVSTALMKPDSRTIDRLVVSAGGVAGIGAHEVALSVNEFKWDPDKGAFRIAKSADELKSMPEWKEATTAATGSNASAGSSSPASSTGTGSAGSGSTGSSGTSDTPKQ
jgi:sporulation protein YlmC with PRC-barrel domain